MAGVNFGLSVSFGSLFQLIAKNANNIDRELELRFYKDSDDLWKVDSKWKPLDDLSHKDLDGLLLILTGLLVMPGEKPKITYRPTDDSEQPALPDNPE